MGAALGKRLSYKKELSVMQINNKYSDYSIFWKLDFAFSSFHFINIYFFIIGNAKFLIYYQFSLFLLVKSRNLAFRNLSVCSSS